MVAYSFQKRFCDKIVRQEKRQTIRGNRKRHARVGEPVQLYYAMRTKHCRKLLIPDPICCRVEPIHIVIPEAPGLALVADRSAELQPVPDRFAWQDGFDDAADFTEFWRDVHGIGDFHGVLIMWAVRCGR